MLRLPGAFHIVVFTHTEKCNFTFQILLHRFMQVIITKLRDVYTSVTSHCCAVRSGLLGG
jgi:hypothetical protein